MKHLACRKTHTLASSLMAVASTLIVPTHAQEESVLHEVTVSANAEVPYKAQKSASPKQTQALVDTPKTIQVLKKEMLQEQGAVSLLEALRNTPSITMQLGENGNTAAGDTFQLRGFSAQQSIFVDGVRDLGAVTRDMFYLEQVEVVKGTAGSEVGRGASAGYINLISKLPTLEQANELMLTLGTGNHKRLSIDTNQTMNDSSALRLNLMVQESDVAERDVVQNQALAIAPAFAFGLNTPTKVYIYSQHIRQDNIPDGGVPTIGMEGFYHANATINSAVKANRANFYGNTHDYERIEADMLTAKIEHELSKNNTVRNITRYGKTHIDRVLTGVNALSLNATTQAIEVARNRQRLDQRNEIIANQTTLNSTFHTGKLKHDVVLGLELLRESQFTLGTTAGSTSTTTVVLNGQTLPVYTSLANVYQPNYRDNLLMPYLTDADTDGQTTTTALYAFDTLSISEALKFNVGLRVDRYRTQTDVATLVTGGTGGNLATYGAKGYQVGDIAQEQFKDADTLLSWNAGLVFKPRANGAVYLAVADAQTPPAAANFALSATTGNQANAALEPQKTTTAEIGTKWELLNKRLNLSAAVYRTENAGQSTQDALSGAYSQEAKTRIEGLELAMVGQLTKVWQVSAGIGLMDSEQLDQRSRNATTGVVTVSDGVRWTPDITASLWTSYTLNKLTVGGGARYVSEQKRVVTTNTPLATQTMPVIPAYTVIDVMAAYKLSKNATLRLNVYNLFDEEYISTLNNSGARATLGAPVSATVTAQFYF